MEITISISERTAEIIRHRAEESGTNSAEYTANIVEETIKNEIPDKNNEKPKRKHNLLKFAGMFSGGDGKTSENYKQILLDEVDSVAGFTTNKEK